MTVSVLQGSEVDVECLSEAEVNGFVGSGDDSYDGSPFGAIVMAGKGVGNPGGGPVGVKMPGPENPPRTIPSDPGGQNQHKGQGPRTGFPSES